MAKLLERRCSCCGHIYKHEDSPSYISFCPKCMKDGFYETYYIEDGIKPCRIFLGEETIGEMTSVTDTSYIITSDRFDIHERIDDSLNPYLEATDMLFYMLREPNKVVRLKEKQRLKRKLKKIESFRFVEGQKYGNLSGVFPEEYKRLKKERDETKSNFESNKYSISSQNAQEIKTLEKLSICKNYYQTDSKCKKGFKL